MVDSSREEQKCTFKDCEQRGIPQKGFDFFICDNCFRELDKALHDGYAKRLKGEV